MAYRTRIKYTPQMQSYMWDRYQAGDSVWSIARSFDRPSSSIHNQLSRTGGIRPPDKKRSPRCLTAAEREEISRGIVAGHSTRDIARSLNRAPSTISREINRNGGIRNGKAGHVGTAEFIGGLYVVGNGLVTRFHGQCRLFPNRSVESFINGPFPCGDW